MSAAVDWTPAMFATLRDLRAGGAGSKRIGRSLGLARSAVERQLAREGLASARRGTARVPTGAALRCARDALPAGHPISWGAISREVFTERRT